MWLQAGTQAIHMRVCVAVRIVLAGWVGGGSFEVKTNDCSLHTCEHERLFSSPAPCLCIVLAVLFISVFVCRCRIFFIHIIARHMSQT